METRREKLFFLEKFEPLKRRFQSGVEQIQDEETLRGLQK